MRIPFGMTAFVALVALGAGAAAVRYRDLVRTASKEAPASPGSREPGFAKVFSVQRFTRGNLHTHTTRSDGDATPKEVVEWYQAHGYGFVALTDHNVLSGRGDGDGSESITVLPSEEITMWARGLPVHVNGLCLEAVIPGGTFPTPADALSHAIGAIILEGGVALVNHPNFDWALRPADVISAAKDGAGLLEIASGHPYVHSLGDAAHPSHEQLWDSVLTAGYDVMGVAVDDMHHLVTDQDPEAFPGVAWVQLFGGDLRPEAVCDALRRGELYASTGPALRSIDVRGRIYAVDPADPDAVVAFIGSGGRVLATAAERPARYVLVGDEGYVRARIETPRGTAWTPAVRVLR